MKSRGSVMAEGLESRTMLSASPLVLSLASDMRALSGRAGRSRSGREEGLGGGSAFQVTSGEPFALILGSFTTKVPATELSAIILWGDRRKSNGKVIAHAAGGFSLQVSGKHTYLAPGTFGVEAQITRAAMSRLGEPTFVATLKNTVVAIAPQSMPLAGALTGTYTHLVGPAFAGSPFSFKGAGNAGIMGGITFRGTVSFPDDAVPSDTVSGELRLANSRGSVTLILRAPFTSEAAFPTSFSYTMDAGTGIYSGSTGAGKLTAMLNSTAAGNTFTFVLS
jgi:hypothetical protein